MKKDAKNFSISRLVVLLFVLAFLVPFSGITASKQLTYNFTAMYINLLLAGLFIMAMMVQMLKPNWIAAYMGAILALPTLLGVTALNWIYGSLRDWYWIAPLAFMYPVAVALPFLHQRLSIRLANTLDAFSIPILVFGWLITSIVMVWVWISDIGDGSISASIAGTFLHFLLVWGEINVAQQAWENLLERMKGNG